MMRLSRYAGAVLASVVLSTLAVAGATASPVTVVAAENFYGNIVTQIGGPRVSVVSILSDPNVDPHEYESNVEDARAIAGADLIIENSGGYDDWMDKLMSASPNAHRVVLKGFDLATYHLPDNEHVWYSPENVKVIAQGIATALKKVDSLGRPVYDKNLAAFLKEVDAVVTKVGEIKALASGKPVALTETIFLYQAGPLGLKVLTPFEFQKAVAEGVEAPAAETIVAENQIRQKQVKVLLYNAQTATPQTQKLQDLAKEAGIPVVAITETMPPSETYQAWMLRQLGALEKALQGTKN